MQILWWTDGKYLVLGMQKENQKRIRLNKQEYADSHNAFTVSYLQPYDLQCHLVDETANHKENLALEYGAQYLSIKLGGVLIR